MKRHGLLVLTCTAALLFNNWLFGVVLNNKLLFKGGSVSELSALDQPHHIVFRTLDIVSGVLFVALAAGAWRVRARGKAFKWMVYATAVLGVANIADAMEPLACSETVNKSCAVPVQVSLSHLSIPSHAYSSIAIAICYLLLPIAGWFYASKIKSQGFGLISLALAILSLAYLVAAAVRYIITGAFSSRAWGPTQELQMLLLGTWFIVWVLVLTKTTSSD